MSNTFFKGDEKYFSGEKPLCAALVTGLHPQLGP